MTEETHGEYFPDTTEEWQTQKITIGVRDLETKYISRQAYDELMELFKQRIAEAQARIDELIPEANAAYAPYREMVQKARAETDKYSTRAYKLEQALRPLLEACYRADEQEELSEFVDGSLLDAAKEALEE